MMIGNNYSINIAKAYLDWDDKPSYRHYAVVELGQITENMAREKFAEFASCFPESDGFSLSLDYVRCSGTTLIKTING